MHKNNPVGLTLLEISGGNPKTQIQANRREHRRERKGQRVNAPGQRIQALGCGVLQPKHRNSLIPGQCAKRPNPPKDTETRPQSA